MAHAVVLTNGFVYDDHWTILRNPALERSALDLLSALFTLDGALVDASRPLMVITSWLERRAFGAGNSIAGHAISLALHLGCVALVARLAFWLVRRRADALAVAAIWSVLPAHVEVIAAINYREDLLASLGVLGALDVLLRPSPVEHGWRRAACVGGALAFALAGKESAMAFVLLVPALAPWDPAWWRRRERSLTAVALVVGLYLSWRMAIPAESAPPRVGSTLAEATARVPGYLGWTAIRPFLPTTSPIYEPLDLPLVSVLALGALVLGALVLCVRHRTRPAAQAGLVLMLAPLVTSPWVGPINERADRYVYLASVGVILLVVLGIRALLARMRAGKRVGLIAGAVGVLALSLGSARAAGTWRDDTRLWTTAVEHAPRSAKAWAGLGWAHRRAGRLDESQAALDRALGLEPERPGTWVVVGGLRLVRGDIEGAQEVVRRLDGVQPRPSGLERLRRCLGAAAPAQCLGDAP
jgi:hypothetical protein